MDDFDVRVLSLILNAQQQVMIQAAAVVTQAAIDAQTAAFAAELRETWVRKQYEFQCSLAAR